MASAPKSPYDDDLLRAIDEDVRLRRAELLSVPGVSEALAAGFRPLEELTGAVELAEVWPEGHLRVLDDTRNLFASAPDNADDRGELPGAPDDESDDVDEPSLADGKVYLVRSPWSSMDVQTVIKLVHRWRRRNEAAFTAPMDPARVIAARRDTVVTTDTTERQLVDRQFFAQDEAWVRAYGRGRVNRLS